MVDVKYEVLDFSDVIDENEEDERFEGWVGMCNVMKCSVW